ncbi:mevalonate kinase [Methanomassiliicoccus luminyensis]|uniref:mevalonate kinase n=1 Tax=Methanomassiliicoccus luminyensis TaxID=1080712 RepID=UPI000376BF5C|nr:mevalonate kinase [Methanomassiliicoccus luminyensis]
MTVVSAPGKIILMGEHAVVFGKPAIALAIGMRLRCAAAPSAHSTVNGEILTERNSSYIMAAMRGHWSGGPLSFEISSDVPSGSGLGSSAAVTVASLGAMASMNGRLVEEDVARKAFDVESIVQGRASPIDTSVSTHGQGIFIDSQKGPDLLWEISRDTRRWFVHHCDVPEMTMVIGFTGIRKPTGPLVAKVKRYADHSSFAREIVDDIGALTLEGAERLRNKDLEALGRLMTKDHNLLAILGVSSPDLQKLVDASLPHSYGAKLTGAGGGGSMIALTDKPDKVAAAIASRGGIPYVVHTGVDGVRVDGE